MNFSNSLLITNTNNANNYYNNNYQEVVNNQYDEFLKTKSKLDNCLNENLQIQNYFSTLLLPQNQKNEIRYQKHNNQHHPQQLFCSNEINNNYNYTKNFKLFRNEKEPNIENHFEEASDSNEISNSLSFNSSINSDEKTNSEQFLIDDEIADQPHLVTLLFTESSKRNEIFVPDYENTEQQSETNLSMYNELFLRDSHNNNNNSRSSDFGDFQFLSKDFFSVDHDIVTTAADDDNDFLMETETELDIEINDDTESIFKSDCLKDLLSIKDMLLQLRKVLISPEDSSENFFINNNINESHINNEKTQQLHINELNRQIDFLKAQLEEKDRIINYLNTERECNYQLNYNSTNNDSCNAATQTDKYFQSVPIQSNFFNRNSKYFN